MKSLILRKYLLRVLVYTAIYAAVVLALDFLLNGALRELVSQVLPWRLYKMMWSNKTATALIFYIGGLLVVSLCYIFRLTMLLSKASKAISQDGILDNGRKCPDELRDFSAKLQEFKQLVKDNEDARKAAEQQKNDLIVYLAHDLKTPLTSVIGYLSLLEESPDIPTEQRAHYVGIALEKAYRLEALINEFFEITRLNLQADSIQKESTNLTVLLLQVVSEFYPMLESKGMTLQQEIAPELKLTADPAKLARVFENLMRNAVNYGFENTPVCCSACAQNGHIFVKISNSGQTISQSKLSRIFDKFYRLDDARQSQTGGAGLGLAIAKQIVELHGGIITARSSDGITEFTVMLPLSENRKNTERKQ